MGIARHQRLLAGQFPNAGLYPADLKQRAIIDQWSYWQAIHLGPTMQRINFERVRRPQLGRGEPDEAAIAGEVKNLGPYLDVFEKGLSHEKDWIAGTLSLADFWISPSPQRSGSARPAASRSKHDRSSIAGSHEWRQGIRGGERRRKCPRNGPPKQMRKLACPEGFGAGAIQ